jgi:hypothetical protein
MPQTAAAHEVSDEHQLRVHEGVRLAR